MATIDQLRDLGYELGIAHGGVDVEQAALDEALQGASTEALVRQAKIVTAETLNNIEQFARPGTFPPPGEARTALANEIAAAALDQLSERADAKVEFQRRARAHAQSVPTVWHVSGHGVAVYVAVDDATGNGADEDAQQLLDSLATVASAQ